MRFKETAIDVPNLWIRKRGFGRREEPKACGAACCAGEAVRDALREVRRGETLRLAGTLGGARAQLEAYVIHPLFYEGTAGELAAEYLREIHHIDVADQPYLWMHYAAAALELGFGGLLPVPVLTSETQGRA